MGTLTATVFGVSLIGSLHCAGMCGPIAALAGGLGNLQRVNRGALLSAYHGGRLVMYVLLGALAGGLGAGLDHGAARLGLPQAAAILAGASMIALGLAAILQQAGVRLALPGTARSPGWLSKLLAVGHRTAGRMTPVPRALVMGLLTVFLPCGWLYAFVLAAAALGQAAAGALLMLAFWAGTVPILAAVGIGAEQLMRRLGARLALVMAFAVVGLGVFMVFQRAALAPERLFAQLAAKTAASVTEVSQLDSTRMPCCHADE